MVVFGVVEVHILAGSRDPFPKTILEHLGVSLVQFRRIATRESARMFSDLDQVGAETDAPFDCGFDHKEMVLSPFERLVESNIGLICIQQY